MEPPYAVQRIVDSPDAASCKVTPGKKTQVETDPNRLHLEQEERKRRRKIFKKTGRELGGLPPGKQVSPRRTSLKLVFNPTGFPIRGGIRTAPNRFPAAGHSRSA
ncbi:hypothetical protein A7E75_07825 [Syntrophotalea acetylenica]|uniref:Uncharacterized protein n=1 Tax=Syntrophotalea acetylenica TaxID=29542 RepID=A0A1L3GGZ7_SYNAC|nr:hypothetical protein A7E75_07825 [Syntrophotalea acetylenica]APG43001.1 hypothetical protein A6070_01785 [Syntrophotalea acetylenica]